MDQKSIILNFLKSQLHMVIATVHQNNTPEAAFVGFAEKDDFSLIFGTYTTTRKYQNIQNNPHVAIVFGGNNGITLQYEGMVSELTGEELNEYKAIYFQKNPSAKQYENEIHEVYLKVLPQWVRYTDYTKGPGRIFEVCF